MEVFEIKKRDLERKPSVGPVPGGSYVCYLLTIAGIVLITGAVLVVFHFVLGYKDLSSKLELLRTGKREHLISEPCEEEFCANKECISMASRIATLMNPNVDPCTDFYEYACGGYRKNTHTPLGAKSYSPDEETLLNILTSIRNVMETTPNGSEDMVLRKMKQIYQSCTDKSKRNEQHINSLNHWLSDMELSLSEDNNEIAIDLGGLGSWRTIVSKLENYQIHTVFEGTFKGFSQSPTEKITIDCPMPTYSTDVYLEPSKENLYKLSVYRDVMNSVLGLLSMDETKRMEFIKNVFQTETDVARAVQNLESLENTGLSEEHILQLKEIWRPLIGDAVQDIEVISSCKYDLGSIISALNRAQPRSASHYVLWRMLYQVVEHLGYDFQSIRLHYAGSVPFWEFSFEKNWQYCADLLRQEMGLATLNLLTENGFLSNSGNIKNEFLELKKEFLRVFRNVPRFDRLTKKLFQNKLQTMNLSFGYPDLIHQPSTLDIVYRDLETSDDHFLNVMSIKKFKTRYDFNRLWYGNSEDPISEISLVKSPVGTNSGYDYRKNIVNVDSSKFQAPLYFYSENMPKHLKFGEFSLLSREIAHAFDSTGCFYDSSGRKWDKTLWPYTLRDNYDFYIECILNQTSTSEYWFAEINDTEWINTIMSDVSSFVIGYESLLKHLESDTEEETSLPGIHLDKKQLYYIQVAQKYCETKLPPSSLALPNDSLLSMKSRVNIAVSNMEDFGTIFKCPRGSVLNPNMKCNLSS